MAHCWLWYGIHERYADFVVFSMYQQQQSRDEGREVVVAERSG